MFWSSEPFTGLEVEDIPQVLIGLSHIEFILGMKIPWNDMNQPHSLLLWLLGFLGKNNSSTTSLS